MVKTYTLAVNVFNGGERFAKTLASIEKVHNLFDEVYISITETEKSHVDFENCKKFKIPNLKINKYSKPGCKSHFINTINNLNTDFVLFLGHDDICHKDGIKEAKDILELSDGSIAIYGSNIIKNNINSEHQVLINDKEFITSDEFALKRIRKEFYLNVTGIFTSSKNLKSSTSIMELNNESYWLDMIAITTPLTKYIAQTKEPICTVNIHKDQMSNNVKCFESYCMDGIWYHFFMLSNTSVKKNIILYINKIDRLGSYISYKKSIKYIAYLYIRTLRFTNFIKLSKLYILGYIMFSYINLQKSDFIKLIKTN
jgi:hypothetical protein